MNQRLPTVLEESARSLYSSLSLRSGVLACWEPTESGRSVAQRFKLRASPPLAFVVANGNKPRVLNLVGASKAEDLEKKIKPALKLEISRIDALKKWPKLCSSRRTCVVIGHRNTAQRDLAVSIFKPLLESHRSVKVVTLDTSFWRLALDDGVLATRPSKESKSADVLCLAREEGSSRGNSTHSGTFLQELAKGTAAGFLKACDQHSDLVPIQVIPKISAKPTKPRKVKATPHPRPPPPPRQETRSSSKRTNVDRVGSRADLEREDEVLFEAVEESEEGQEADSSEDDEASDDSMDEGEDVSGESTEDDDV